MARAGSSLRGVLCANRERVYRLLVRRLGRQQAEDAFQETFLRALRAYDRAAPRGAARRLGDDDRGAGGHRPHRAAARRTRLLEAESWDGRPAHSELEHLAGGLPPTERAAVVLRYGYDLDYEQIGAVLGSNATAARQAASAGVRRLRRSCMTLPDTLDTRFRDAASAAGLLDAAYDVTDSPVGELLLAATDRGVCWIEFSPERPSSGSRARSARGCSASRGA